MPTIVYPPCLLRQLYFVYPYIRVYFESLGQDKVNLLFKDNLNNVLHQATYNTPAIPQYVDIPASSYQNSNAHLGVIYISYYKNNSLISEKQFEFDLHPIIIDCLYNCRFSSIVISSDINYDVKSYIYHPNDQTLLVYSSGSNGGATANPPVNNLDINKPFYISVVTYNPPWSGLLEKRIDYYQFIYPFYLLSAYTNGQNVFLNIQTNYTGDIYVRVLSPNTNIVSYSNTHQGPNISITIPISTYTGPSITLNYWISNDSQLLQGQPPSGPLCNCSILLQIARPQLYMVCNETLCIDSSSISNIAPPFDIIVLENNNIIAQTSVTQNTQQQLCINYGDFTNKNIVVKIIQNGNEIYVGPSIYIPPKIQIQLVGANQINIQTYYNIDSYELYLYRGVQLIDSLVGQGQVPAVWQFDNSNLQNGDTLTIQLSVYYDGIRYICQHEIEYYYIDTGCYYKIEDYIRPQVCLYAQSNHPNLYMIRIQRRINGILLPNHLIYYTPNIPNPVIITPNPGEYGDWDILIEYYIQDPNTGQVYLAHIDTLSTYIAAVKYEAFFNLCNNSSDCFYVNILTYNNVCSISSATIHLSQGAFGLNAIPIFNGYRLTPSTGNICSSLLAEADNTLNLEVVVQCNNISFLINESISIPKLIISSYINNNGDLVVEASTNLTGYTLNVQDRDTGGSVVSMQIPLYSGYNSATYALPPGTTQIVLLYSLVGNNMSYCLCQQTALLQQLDIDINCNQVCITLHNLSNGDYELKLFSNIESYQQQINYPSQNQVCFTVTGLGSDFLVELYSQTVPQPTLTWQSTIHVPSVQATWATPPDTLNLSVSGQPVMWAVTIVRNNNIIYQNAGAGMPPSTITFPNPQYGQGIIQITLDYPNIDTFSCSYTYNNIEPPSDKLVIIYGGEDGSNGSGFIPMRGTGQEVIDAIINNDPSNIYALRNGYNALLDANNNAYLPVYSGQFEAEYDSNTVPTGCSYTLQATLTDANNNTYNFTRNNLCIPDVNINIVINQNNTMFKIDVVINNIDFYSSNEMNFDWYIIYDIGSICLDYEMGSIVVNYNQTTKQATFSTPWYQIPPFLSNAPNGTGIYFYFWNGAIHTPPCNLGYSQPFYDIINNLLNEDTAMLIFAGKDLVFETIYPQTQVIFDWVDEKMIIRSTNIPFWVKKIRHVVRGPLRRYNEHGPNGTISQSDSDYWINIDQTIVLPPNTSSYDFIVDNAIFYSGWDANPLPIAYPNTFYDNYDVQVEYIWTGFSDDSNIVIQTWASQPQVQFMVPYFGVEKEGEVFNSTTENDTNARIGVSTPMTADQYPVTSTFPNVNSYSITGQSGDSILGSQVPYSLSNGLFNIIYFYQNYNTVAPSSLRIKPKDGMGNELSWNDYLPGQTPYYVDFYIKSYSYQYTKSNINLWDRPDVGILPNVLSMFRSSTNDILCSTEFVFYKNDFYIKTHEWKKVGWNVYELFSCILNDGMFVLSNFSFNFENAKMYLCNYNAHNNPNDVFQILFIVSNNENYIIGITSEYHNTRFYTIKLFAKISEDNFTYVNSVPNEPITLILSGAHVYPSNQFIRSGLSNEYANGFILQPAQGTAWINNSWQTINYLTYLQDPQYDFYTLAFYLTPPKDKFIFSGHRLGYRTDNIVYNQWYQPPSNLDDSRVNNGINTLWFWPYGLSTLKLFARSAFSHKDYVSSTYPGGLGASSKTEILNRIFDYNNADTFYLMTNSNPITIDTNYRSKHPFSYSTLAVNAPPETNQYPYIKFFHSQTANPIDNKVIELILTRIQATGSSVYYGSFDQTACSLPSNIIEVIAPHWNMNRSPL